MHLKRERIVSMPCAAENLNRCKLETSGDQHGHLDHTLNIARLKELSGCQIYAPGKDYDLIAGHHCYEGWNKIGGLFENIGAGLINYQPPIVDHWFESGDTLDYVGGLEVISLPGHTPGHCGFLLRDRELLFANDLFSNHFGKPKAPPLSSPIAKERTNKKSNDVTSGEITV